MVGQDDGRLVRAGRGRPGPAARMWRAGLAAVGCRRRRRTASTGPPRKATPMSRPAASSRVFSHRGMPAGGRRCLGPGRGRCPVPLAGDGDGAGRGRWAGPGAGGDGAAGCGTVEHGPGADQVRIGADDMPVGRVQGRPAAAHGQGGRDARPGCHRPRPCSGPEHPAGQHQDGARADDVRIGADARPVGRVQGRPAAAHGEPGGDAGQTCHRPARHTWRRGAPPSSVPRPRSACWCGRVTWVVLLAVRVFAWAGGTDPFIPAATRTSAGCSRRARRTRTSSTHA